MSSLKANSIFSNGHENTELIAAILDVTNFNFINALSDYRKNTSSRFHAIESELIEHIYNGDPQSAVALLNSSGHLDDYFLNKIDINHIDYMISINAYLKLSFDYWAIRDEWSKDTQKAFLDGNITNQYIAGMKDHFEDQLKLQHLGWTVYRYPEVESVISECFLHKVVDQVMANTSEQASSKTAKRSRL